MRGRAAMAAIGNAVYVLADIGRPVVSDGHPSFGALCAGMRALPRGGCMRQRGKATIDMRDRVHPANGL